MRRLISQSKFLRATMISFGIGIVSLSVGMYALRLANVDPFAHLRDNSGGPLGDQIGLRLEDVKLRHFKGGELLSSVEVDRVDIRQDRQYLDLFDLKNGSIRFEKNEVAFDAPHAAWNAVASKLEITNGARVRNKDMDLLVSTFTYDDRAKKLNVPGEIQGKLFDGQGKAQGLIYDMAAHSYRTGPITWEGMVALQEAGRAEPTRWHIQGDDVNVEGDNQIFTNAVATDGEIMLRAPRVERNARTDVLTATGKVYYYSPKANLVADKAVVDRRNKKATLTTNVQMLIKPESEQRLQPVDIQPFRPSVPDEISRNRPPAPAPALDGSKQLDDDLRSPRTARRYPTVIVADKVEYWYAQGQRRAVVTGNPQARQELPGGRWRYAWSWQAVYDGEKEMLYLTSSNGQKNTRVKTSIGDDLVATSAEMSTRDDRDLFSAKGVDGHFFTADDEIPRSGGATTSPPPPR
jgi:hypothetical protein